jgi:hypothetical protein
MEIGKPIKKLQSPTKNAFLNMRNDINSVICKKMHGNLRTVITENVWGKTSNSVYQGVLVSIISSINSFLFKKIYGYR